MSHCWLGLIFAKLVFLGPFPSHPIPSFSTLSSFGSLDCTQFSDLQGLNLVSHILTHPKPNLMSFVLFAQTLQSTRKFISESQSDLPPVSFYAM